MWIYILSVLNFTIACLYTPGPNNTMLMNSGFQFGYLRTFPHLMGIQVGFLVLNAMVALGLGQIFILFPQLQVILAVLGSAYLLYLAYKSWQVAKIANGHKKPKPMSFMEAAIFQFINPKAWIIAIAAMTAYTHTEHFSYNWAVVIVLVSFFMNGFGSSSAWALIGVMGAKLVQKRPKFIEYFNKAMAILLVLSIILLWL